MLPVNLVLKEIHIIQHPKEGEDFAYTVETGFFQHRGFFNLSFFSNKFYSLDL